MAVVSFKCPNCDGELIFDPASQNYKCEYCSSKFTQRELDAMQQAPANGRENKAGTDQRTSAGEDARLYSCPSCGAQILTDATTAATYCYYCHNPVILGTRLSGEFLPDRIIPFTVTKEAAVKGFLDYVGKKKFVPKAFFNKSQIESMSGVYFPYWSYDVDLAGRLEGEARRVRTWRSGDIVYTETKHYAVVREGNISLDNLTETALNKANQKLIQGVMPFDFSKTKPFHMGYLSGFLAEKRDIEQSAVKGKMQGKMRGFAEQLLRQTVSGYSSHSLRNIRFHALSERFSYCLYPVWTLTYKAKDGKIYYYSMNGQTGKVCGELPLDYKKLSLVSAVVFAVVAALGLIGGYLV